MALIIALVKGSPKSDEGRITKEIELEELKESRYDRKQRNATSITRLFRKQWQPPVIQKNDSTSSVQDEIISLQVKSVNANKIMKLVIKRVHLSCL